MVRIEFYEAVAQVIPVLLLAEVARAALVARTYNTAFMHYSTVVVVVAEVAALFSCLAVIADPDLASKPTLLFVLSSVASGVSGTVLQVVIPLQPERTRWWRDVPILLSGIIALLSPIAAALLVFVAVS